MCFKCRGQHELSSPRQTVAGHGELTSGVKHKSSTICRSTQCPLMDPVSKGDLNLLICSYVKKWNETN